MSRTSSRSRPGPVDTPCGLGDTASTVHPAALAPSASTGMLGPFAEPEGKPMLADVIRSARQKEGYTQERLAGAVGVSKRTITRIESGSPVLAETLLAICSVLCLDHATLDGIRRDEMAAEPSVPEVLASDNPSVARHLIPDAIAILRDQPGVALVALPDPRSWRATQPHPRGADLERPVFRGRERRAVIWYFSGFALVIAALILMATGLAFVSTWNRATFLPGLILTLAAGGCAILCWVMGSGERLARMSGLEKTERLLERVAYGISERSVYLVVSEDDRISLIRHDLSSKRDVVRTDLGSSVSYAFRTDRGSVRIDAIPHDPRVDAIMMRVTRDDPVRRFERPLAAAA
jgi:transcriptional regulator with XRE-family HTH domain